MNQIFSCSHSKSTESFCHIMGVGRGDRRQEKGLYPNSIFLKLRFTLNSPELLGYCTYGQDVRPNKPETLGEWPEQSFFHGSPELKTTLLHGRPLVCLSELLPQNFLPCLCNSSPFGFLWFLKQAKLASNSGTFTQNFLCLCSSHCSFSHFSHVSLLKKNSPCTLSKVALCHAPAYFIFLYSTYHSDMYVCMCFHISHQNIKLIWTGSISVLSLTYL